jgi:hypothetical protein
LPFAGWRREFEVYQPYLSEKRMHGLLDQKTPSFS